MAEIKAKKVEDTKSETARREEEIASFWREHHLFEKSVEKEAPKGEFVFYDGPPFATGLPHYGSLLSSIIKDVVPRYKTMRGYRVNRRWGWDCHGLPIESLIEKRLGLKTKKDIEAIGIAAFNEAARSSVMEFEREWEKYVERVGRWVDFRHSYKTMDNSYIESVWWALKSLYDKSLLYEGRKVLMYCPHCETPLAKAEIAMDNTYKDVTDEAAVVEFELKDTPNTSVLAWTTTPWTLPGNKALAVNPEIVYTTVVKEGSNKHYIVAKERLEAVFGKDGYKVVKEQKGNDLIGLSYVPLYEAKGDTSAAHKVYAGGFVTTEDGTGVVHIAPMYGEDDFSLGQKENLPMIQMLDAGGHYNELAPSFLQSLYYKKGEKEVMKDLEGRGLLFSHAPHTHSYPHCYRCGTALIYNAVSSWFINIQNVKQRLLEENEKVTWVPEHLKHGRFQHIVENAPDWTISRNRFWASPLPIWKEKGGSRIMVVGSIDELKEKEKKSGNRYTLMRHGESTYFDKHIYTSDPNNEYGLTENGRKEVLRTAKTLPQDLPVVIVSSPVQRAKESAEIVAETLGVAKEEIVFDERLGEVQFGVYENKPKKEWDEFVSQEDWYTRRPEEGESLEDVKVRMGQALYDIEKRWENKRVIIVTHAVGFSSLTAVCQGIKGDTLLDASGAVVPPAYAQDLPFIPLPVNAKFEIDLHRPYTDSIVLLDENGREYERIPEVIDCWAESGSMPFAAYHYPFENKQEFEKHAPGDFVAEYIAQTRTWFYYMHAMSVLLFDRQSFRTVMSTGTLLAADGSKMSKSKGNYTDPLLLLDRFGADALRFNLMGSVVMQSEDVAFRDEDVREVHNRVIGILWNSFKFFELYQNEYDPVVRGADSTHPLDRWVRSRLGQVIREVTDAFEAYDTPQVARVLRAFIDDYSTWYVRRSRDRVKGEDREDKLFALSVQKEVLLALTKLIAPIMPFIAESIYKGIGGAEESVHLESWPEDIAVDEKLLVEMTQIRALASKALQIRDEAGIKVRQPLSTLSAQSLPMDGSLRQILADEVNVKQVTQDAKLPIEVTLDLTITDELKQEGILRDVVRAIQDLRKKEGLLVGDRPALRVHTDASGAVFFEAMRDSLITQTGLSRLDVKEDGEVAKEDKLPFAVRFFLEK